jgi:selenide,water dikinase
MPVPAPGIASATRIALIGAGHAHVEVLRQAAVRAQPDPRLVLVVDRHPAIYSGMLPGFVAGHYRATELAIDAVSLARRAGAEVVLEKACRIDAASQRVVTESGREIAYDFASLDVGSGVLGRSLPGVDVHALPVRPIERLIEGVGALLARAREHSAGAPFRLIVVGAGAGGVELAFCFEARLRRETSRPLAVTLLDRGDAVLPGAAASLVRRVTRAARRRGIDLKLGAAVEALETGIVRLANGRTLAADAVVWSTGPAAHSFLRESELPVDAQGFVRVRPTLQVVGYDRLFAVGDCASLAGMQKAGVYAVRCGPILAENLRRAQAGLALRVYRPQRNFLSLLNLGDGTAVGVERGFSFEGRWVMRLKDRIDRRFMEKYR